MGWEQDLDEVRRVYGTEGTLPTGIAGSRTFHPALLPLPLVAQESVPEDAGEIVLDLLGRPVAATSGTQSFTWEWREDGSVLERAMTLLGPRVTLIRRDVVVSVDMLSRESVQRLTWDGDVAVRADEALRWEGGGSRGTDVARRAVFGPDGAVQQVRRFGAEAEGDVEAGLARAAGFSPTEVSWTPAGTGEWPAIDAKRPAR